MGLKEVREARYNDAKEVMLGFNIQSMAGLLGCSYQTYQKKEDDPENNLSMTEAKVLSEYLDCSWQDLYSGDEQQLDCSRG